MKQIIYIIFSVFFLMSIVSCSDNISDIPLSTTNMVVEGWIEPDSVAKVMLTHAILSSEGAKSDVDNLLLKNAEVYISNGQITEKMDYSKSTIFPYGIYQGHHIIGSTGQGYSLSVKWNEINAESFSQIYPDEISIDSTECKNASSSSPSVYIFFNDSDYKNNYYLLLVKQIGVDDRYYPSINGCINGSLCFSPHFKVNLLRSIRDISDGRQHFMFNSGDSLSVKISRINESSYDFWNSFFIATINKSDPVFPTISNLQSTINGAFGIWSGYNGKTFNFTIH